MATGSDGIVSADTYALVTYIPDPLGKFLDDLRRRVDLGCDPHAHVTLMPPRQIQASAGEAWEQIYHHTRSIPAFQLHAANVEVFPQTNVIFIDIGLGRQSLIDIHRDLNRDALWFQEPYSYHPHITIAQELPPEKVPEAAEAARRLWKEFPHSRIFPVDTLTFVHSVVKNRWRDLASVQLVHDQVPARR